MILFRSVYSYCATLGICRNPSNQKHHFNGKILIIYFTYLLNTMLHCLFLIHNVQSFEEYADLTFRISVSALTTIFYTIVIFQMERFFELLDMLNEMTGKSKCGFNRYLGIFHSNIGVTGVTDLF